METVKIVVIIPADIENVFKFWTIVPFTPLLQAHQPRLMLNHKANLHAGMVIFPVVSLKLIL
jgi:hypothetical protein